MAKLETDFNPNEVPEDERGFEPIPAGDYLMQVIESSIVPTKSGSGEQLVLVLEVIDGLYANRRMWDRLNIRNQSAEAQRIAQRALADLCLAIGLASLRDTEELHFNPFLGRVTIQADKTGTYGPQNRVRYKSTNAGQAPARPTKAASAKSVENGQAARPTIASSTQTSSRYSGGGGRPWNR